MTRQGISPVRIAKIAALFLIVLGFMTLVALPILLRTGIWDREPATQDNAGHEPSDRGKPQDGDDFAFVNPNSRVPVANVASPSKLASASSTANSATGLSSLPAGAQGPISAALGKDNSAYWIHPSAEGFGGKNPQQGLVVEFTRCGAEVRSQNLRWGLEMRNYGYGDSLHPVKRVAPQASANRVEYHRDGVAEWYKNGPLGLEQGFTLAHRPRKAPGKAPGNANDQPLTLELGLQGDLFAALEAGSKALELRRKDGKAALRYAGLQARDATGRELRSWLEVRGERLLVRVDDAEARYPVVVDPWIQQAELKASDDGSGFGWSVAVDGGTVVVGAVYDTVGSNSLQGAAYVFVDSGGTWSQQAKLTASDGSADDYFGISVAVSGSTIVVGAWEFYTGGPGAAYVFVRNGTTWSQQAELTASDGAARESFGYSVALDGSTAVVGAPGNLENASTPGAAYVFVQSGTTWSQQAVLTASDGAARESFGYSVALDGSTAVVGAPQYYADPSAPGAAYVFVQSGTTWSQQAELTASDGAAKDQFGNSVAVDGSTAVVGAPNHTVGSNANQGAAYVFVQSGTTWSQQAELTASDGAAKDQFGNSVAVDGSTAVVGAPNHTVASNANQGAAYVFVQSGTTLSQQAELTASDGAAKDQFGNSVAVYGRTAMVGSPGSNTGRAYVFGSSGPLYTISASPSSLNIVQGSQATSTITLTPFHGFSGSVSFSASGLPSGVTAAFNPNPATSTSTLTLTASETAATGTATVIVIGTSGSLAQTATLTLTVPPIVTLTPASLSFGDSAVNNTSAAKTVTLKNTGTSTLEISSIAITLGTNFTISRNTCGSTLAAGKTCKVSVTFTPTQVGAATDTLSFTDNGFGSPQTVSLSGTGVAQARLTPASVAFDITDIGTTHAAKNVTLVNHLPTTLTGISYSTTGPFAVSTATCGTTLDSGRECTISVTFSPTETGTATGTLTVTDSANNSPQTVSLSGLGEAQVTLTPGSYHFPRQIKVGRSSAEHKFTLKNNLLTTVTGISISTTGPFVVSTATCGTTLGGNSTCNIWVAFGPTQAGPATGTLIVSDSADNSPQMASLSGTGVADVTLTPSSLSFPATEVGSTSPAQETTLDNDFYGSVAVSYSTTGPFAVSSSTCPTVLRAWHSCTISVTFSPTQTGLATGTLTVTAGDYSPLTSTLTGTGQ
jgi:FG-GAP repeat/Abnormal spindle-like microcephaly-assoc'd, ASPM-SPD-2-Hydin